MKNLNLTKWFLVGALCYAPHAFVCDTNFVAKTKEEKEAFWQANNLIYDDSLTEPEDFPPLNFLSDPDLYRLFHPFLYAYGNDYLAWRKDQAEKIRENFSPPYSEADARALTNELLVLSRPIARQIVEDRFVESKQKLMGIGITDLVFDHGSPHYNASLSIRHVPEINEWGVFAEDEFAEGDFIAFYPGKVYYYPKDTSAMMLYLSLPDSEITESTVAEALRFPETANKKFAAFLAELHPYLLVERGENYEKAALVIDGTDIRNEASFINHSDRFNNCKFLRVLRVKIAKINGDTKFESVTYAVAVIATKTIKIDDQLMVNYQYDPNLRERIGVSFLDLNPQQNSCYTCSNSPEQIKKCAGCNVARYCDKECQRKDWPKHKDYCHKHTKKSEH